MPPRRRRIRKKVVATASRRVCVYKRTGKPSEPFYEKGGTVKQVTDFFAQKNRNKRNLFRRGDPYEIRTRVAAVKGRSLRPLDQRAIC